MVYANVQLNETLSVPPRLAEFRSELLDSLPTLRRFAAGYCRTPHDADDAVQLTCERALARWRQWTGEGPLEHWLVKILANVWRDETRSRRLRSGPNLDSVPEPKSDSSDAADSLYLEEVLQEVDLLPDGQRDVLLLVAGEGLSYRETAERLDIPVGTVMSRLSRGRKALIRRLGTDGGRAASQAPSAHCAPPTALS
jgi:RNA polymerase sigma-70 factor, ECF subfamily